MLSSENTWEFPAASDESGPSHPKVKLMKTTRQDNLLAPAECADDKCCIAKPRLAVSGLPNVMPAHGSACSKKTQVFDLAMHGVDSSCGDSRCLCAK